MAAWSGLTPEERATIQRSHVIEVRDPSSFGVIVDSQGVDESMPGTSGGARLGGAVAEASYLDNAFKPGNNYSARGQLGAAVLGSLLGSALDAQAVQRHRLRYAVKLPDGEIRVLDSVQPNRFRLPAGLCVSVPDLAQIAQGVCSHASADLRRLHLAGALGSGVANASVAPPPASVAAVPPEPDSGVRAAGADKLTDPTRLVSCRTANLAPVQTTLEKCNSIGGEVK